MSPTYGFSPCPGMRAIIEENSKDNLAPRYDGRIGVCSKCIIGQGNMDWLVLVHEHKTNGRDLIPSGTSVMHQKCLDHILMQKSNLGVYSTKIKLAQGQLSFDICKRDMGIMDWAVFKMGLEEVPWRVFLGHEFQGHEFREVVVVFDRAFAGHSCSFRLD